MSRFQAQAPGAERRTQRLELRSRKQEKPARVTTTVVVHGEVKDDYLPETVTVGTLDGATLLAGAALGHRRHARPAQRPGFAPAF